MADPDPAPASEWSLINWIQQQVPQNPDVLVGIGDDAAVIDPRQRRCVMTVDVITDQIDFLTATTPPELIGRKALAVNLSDMAAMAAEPAAAFIGLVLPKTLPREFVECMYEGIFSLAREWNVAIAGGDTNSWDGPLAISITLMGWAGSKGAVTRAGAQPGDWLMVTGGLGGSLPSDRHLTFTPRIREAHALQQAASLHAMMDLSDGLASDLFHILNASGVGAILQGESIPIHSDVDLHLPFEERLQHALNDGEDFELLFAVSPEEGAALLREPPFATSLTKIGEVTAEAGARIVMAGSEKPLARGGWSHHFGGNESPQSGG